jgi:hypothetical protein
MNEDIEYSDQCADHEDTEASPRVNVPIMPRPTGPGTCPILGRDGCTSGRHGRVMLIWCWRHGHGEVLFLYLIVWGTAGEGRLDLSGLVDMTL